MKKIEAYKLSNGQIIENEKDAILLEKELAFKKELEIFAEDNVDYFDNQTMFINIVEEHGEEIFKILAKKFA